MTARWAVDVSGWAVGTADWAFALSLLPEPEQRQVTRFLFAKDQRLALASRLLQRALIRDHFGVPWSAVDLARTPENKPFWRRQRAGHGAPPVWNFNVSHHGTLVAIACHARALVGVDVVRVSDWPRGSTSADEFFRAFADHFTASEWAYIRQPGGEQFARFYRLWSLKEAYIKAVGIGLGFSLQRAEFSQCEGDRWWRMRLDGQVADEWAFECAEIGGDHLVSVALGPVGDMWRSGDDDKEASSIFPVPMAELAELQTGGGTSRGDGPSEWRMLSLAELTAYAQAENEAGTTAARARQQNK